MKEALDNANQELKRVDHLYYVSLKYTRTVDMMKHMVERLISTISFGIESLLKHAKEEKKIDEIPNNLGLRCKLVLEVFSEDEIADYMHLYLKLRKILRAKYTKREEYRRHVTMTATLDNGEIAEINIDILKEHYDSVRNFIRIVKIIEEGEEEDI